MSEANSTLGLRLLRYHLFRKSRADDLARSYLTYGNVGDSRVLMKASRRMDGRAKFFFSFRVRAC